MTIEKKSLISTLKTTKKANAVKDDLSSGASTGSAQKMPSTRTPAIRTPSTRTPAVRTPSLRTPSVRKPSVRKPSTRTKVG